MIRLNFVCLGNICRSPFAEALARYEVEQRGLAGQFHIDSCGTSNEHQGQSSHALSIRVGTQLGLKMDHRSRQFKAREFAEWDYILTMDSWNHRDILSLTTTQEERDKVSLLLSWHPDSELTDVPDPWGYGEVAYHQMRDIITGALTPFLETIIDRHDL